MVGHGESVRYIGPGQEHVWAGRAGATLNLLSVDGDAVITLEGTQFELHEATLARTTAKGVSNRILKDAAKLKVHSGVILAVVERKKQEYYVL